MLLSMTGFSTGRIVVKTKSGLLSLIVEVKTFNTRFFETVCKLPPALSAFEVKIVNEIQQKLLRGRVYLAIRFAQDNEAFERVVPALGIVEGYLEASALLKKKFKLSGTLSLADVLSLPDVFVQDKSELLPKEEQLFFAELHKIIDELVVTRRQEGVRLQKDFEKRFAVCKSRINDIEKRFDSLMAEKKALIDKQLSLVQSGDEQAKSQSEDLYASINKMDVHEEITRFKSHLEGVTFVIQDKKQVDKGKRLDFILQELLREINTLMAKCSNFDISSLSVDVKVELEKAREQIQNIV